MDSHSNCSIKPADVLPTISRWLLCDGFEVVIDMERSEGSYITDSISGEKWLDFYSFVASAPFGMNHPKLANKEFKEKIFRAAINKISNSDIYTREYAEFVELFSQIAVPDGFEHLFFIDYGTLAVENALKVAMDWKVQKLIERGGIGEKEAFKGQKGTRVIYFNEAFHGRSGYTLSLTNTFEPNKTKYFAKFDNWEKVLNPKVFWPEDKYESMIDWAEKFSISQIKNILAEDPDGFCAIIIEPIQGEGGDNHFRTSFFRELRKICDEMELLLIFDEVQSGMGITGKMWAWEHHGIRPDIFAFGKKAQVCGICANKRIDEISSNCWNTSSRLNSTWGGNLVDMVRASKYLEIYREENILEHVARKVGPLLLESLLDIQEEFQVIRNVRGKGLMCAYDLPDTDTRDRFLSLLHDERMLVLPCGPKTIRYRPALNISSEAISEGMGITRKCLKKL